MQIPQSYTISKFFTYANQPTQSKTYLNGGCPTCREGTHYGKRKRLFYMLREDYLYCHNCARAWTPYWWIKEQSGMSFREIQKDIKDYTGDDIDFITQFKHVEEKEFILPELPGECINLRDSIQLNYYKDSHIVTMAKNYCESRRLFTALNTPKTMFVCISDFYHKNRLIIPFYNSLDKIESYISRKLLDSDQKAKYLLKFNSSKPLYNLSKVDNEFPYIFIFEGPIDCMFVKNGVSISGVHLTTEQEHELSTNFPFHKKIWVFDNFRMESDEVKKKIIAKLKEGERVFLYDGDFSSVKDLNDYCKAHNLDSIDPYLILNGSYEGQKGLIKLTMSV